MNGTSASSLAPARVSHPKTIPRSLAMPAQAQVRSPQTSPVPLRRRQRQFQAVSLPEDTRPPLSIACFPVLKLGIKQEKKPRAFPPCAFTARKQNLRFHGRDFFTDASNLHCYDGYLVIVYMSPTLAGVFVLTPPTSCPISFPRQVSLRSSWRHLENPNRLSCNRAAGAGKATPCRAGLFREIISGSRRSPREELGAEAVFN